MYQEEADIVSTHLLDVALGLGVSISSWALQLHQAWLLHPIGAVTSSVAVSSSGQSRQSHPVVAAF